VSTCGRLEKLAEFCSVTKVVVCYFTEQAHGYICNSSGSVIFSVKIHVKLSHDSLFAVKIFLIDFSEN